MPLLHGRKEANMERCKHPDGVTIKPDGIHELDPCVYEEEMVVPNVTVRVLRCVKCGHVEIEWERGEDDA
jgi:hypothetical protein